MTELTTSISVPGGAPQEPDGPIAPEEAQAAAPVTAGSLQQRLHDRRAQLQSQRTEDFDVPGYTGVIVARYRLLGWKENRVIAARAEREQRDPSTRELYIAADTLINACEGLLEYREDGNHVATGQRWGVKAATELFGVPPAEAGETARQALLACFPQDTLLMAHYGQLMEWHQGNAPDVDQELEGELGKQQTAS